METRWINHSLPQTLANATILLYINAAFGLLFGLANPIALAFVGGQVAAGWGIANERKWGYQLGIAMAFLPAVIRFLLGGIGAVLGINVLSLLFEIALIALLLHRDSQQHQKIWFR